MSASKQATQDAKIHMIAPLGTPTDLSSNAIKDIAPALNVLLSDVFALYMKTKNFHWHMSGPHFRDYHLLLDEHGDQIFAMTGKVWVPQPQGSNPIEASGRAICACSSAIRRSQASAHSSPPPIA